MQIVSNFEELWRRNKSRMLHTGVCSHLIAVCQAYIKTGQFSKLVREFAASILYTDYSKSSYQLIFNLIQNDLTCQVEFGTNKFFSHFLEEGINQNSIVLVLKILKIFLFNEKITNKVNVDYLKIAQNILNFYYNEGF